jgi:hypothetical protein
MLLYKAERIRADLPKTNHIMHLLFTFLTVGFYLPIWVLAGMVSMHQRHYLKVKADKLEAQALEIVE